MNNNLLKFDEMESTAAAGIHSTRFALPQASTNPYDTATSPKDIFEYLAPDGTMFGLYADPYASMKYVNPKKGNHNARYWLSQRLEDFSFTDRELKLIDFLSTHRVATRNQIARVVFDEEDSVDKIRNFITKCRQRGIICAFSWVTPLDDGRKKPLVYGLTRVGAEAVEMLWHREVAKEFKFQPIEFTTTRRGPNMMTFFTDLLVNELYSEFVRLDRLIKWERRPSFKILDGIYQPSAQVELIKDAGQFFSFWIDTIRIKSGWVEHLNKRIHQMKQAYQKAEAHMKPDRIILVIDGDSRIMHLAPLIHEIAPELPIRYSTDERLLQGINRDTFLIWDESHHTLRLSAMSFLTDKTVGMTATAYFASQEDNIEDEDFED